MPQLPYFIIQKQDDEWIEYRFSPEKQKDYFNREDVFVGSMISKRLFEAVQDSYFFDSERFSKNNELFCYLKIDDADSKMSTKDVANLIVKLDDYLRSEKLGCIIGRAIGLRYLYIDMALIDIASSIQKIREMLQASKLAKRSWILFYDAELVYQWLGIWKDSPTPLVK